MTSNASSRRSATVSRTRCRYGETRDGDGRVPRHRPADCGMPVDVAFQEYAGYIVSSGRRRSKRHRGACLGIDHVPEVVLPATSCGETMLPCLSQPREHWLHGEVDAFDSHEQVCSGLRKSQIAAAPA